MASSFWGGMAEHATAVCEFRLLCCSQPTAIACPVPYHPYPEPQPRGFQLHLESYGHGWQLPCLGWERWVGQSKAAGRWTPAAGGSKLKLWVCSGFHAGLLPRRGETWTWRGRGRERERARGVTLDRSPKPIKWTAKLNICPPLLNFFQTI